MIPAPLYFLVMPNFQILARQNETKTKKFETRPRHILMPIRLKTATVLAAGN